VSRTGARRRLLVAGLGGLVAALALTAPLSGHLHRRGTEARERWQLASAQRCLLWSWRLRPGSDRLRLDAAECLQLAGEFLRSQRLVAPLLDDPGTDLRLRARALDAAGVNEFHLARPRQALAHHRASLELARELGDLELELRTSIGLGRVLYHSLGRPQEALGHLETALARARAAGETGLEADALRHIGAVRWWYGNEAELPLEGYYLPALETYRRRGDLHGVATALSNVALLRRTAGDPLLSLRYQTRSLELRRRIGDRAGESDSLRHLGEFWVALGNHRKGRDAFARSLAISRRIGHHLTADEAQLGLSHAVGKLGDARAAIRLASRLVDDRGGQPSVATKYTLASLAQWHLALGDPDAAERSLLAARALGARSGDSDPAFEAASMVVLAEAAMRRDDLPAARERLARAKSAGARRPESRAAYGLRKAEAELARREGRRGDAVRLLMEAADLERESRVKASESVFAAGYPELFDPLFALLLDTPARSGVAGAEEAADAAAVIFRYLEEHRHRNLDGQVLGLGRTAGADADAAARERQALARIEAATRGLGRGGGPSAVERLDRAYGRYEDLLIEDELAADEDGAAEIPPAVTLAELRARMPPATALLAYLPVHGTLHALTVTRTRAAVVELPLRLEQLEPRVLLFRDLLARDPEAGSPAGAAGGDPLPAQLLTAAADLHARLLEPVESAGLLAGIRRLGILPFGALYDLPFAALLDRRGERGGRFLIEDYTLFYPPSATFLVRAGETPRHGGALDAVLALGIGRPSDPRAPSLDHAVAEAEISAELLGGRVLADAGATETAFKELAPRYRFLHLASHGNVEPRMPLLSTLELEPTRLDDGSLSVREILGLPLGAAVVSLGACGSGRGFSTSGHPEQLDRLGLAEAFLYAGARSVVASHLEVRDRSSLLLMRSFYARLRRLGPAEALAEAQRAILRGEEGAAALPATGHPRHWAAFFLAGDPD